MIDWDFKKQNKIQYILPTRNTLYMKTHKEGNNKGCRNIYHASVHQKKAGVL